MIALARRRAAQVAAKQGLPEGVTQAEWDRVLALPDSQFVRALQRLRATHPELGVPARRVERSRRRQSELASQLRSSARRARAIDWARRARVNGPRAAARCCAIERRSRGSWSAGCSCRPMSCKPSESWATTRSCRSTAGSCASSCGRMIRGGPSSAGSTAAPGRRGARASRVGGGSATADTGDFSSLPVTRTGSGGIGLEPHSTLRPRRCEAFAVRPHRDPGDRPPTARRACIRACRSSCASRMKVPRTSRHTRGSGHGRAPRRPATLRPR